MTTSPTPTARQLFTISDVLKEIPLYAPIAFNSQVASSTRGISNFDVNMELADRLLGVVFFPGLAEQIRIPAAEWMASRLPNPLNDTEAQAWRPKYTCRQLPPYVHAEQDTREWVATTCIRPALGILKACVAGAILPPDTHLVTSKPYYASWSGPATKPIPDNVLWLRDPSQLSQAVGGKNAKTMKTELEAGDMTIEIKTANAMMKAFDVKRPMYDLASGNAVVVPFVWPENVEDETTSKETKILVQVGYLSFCDFQMHS